jgi:flavin-dependent dehydrogenase
MADVLVAGGGPAGSALAILAGRGGIAVDLFDTAHFPRDKPCGEGLMPAGVGALTRLDLCGAVGGQHFVGVSYHGFGITAEARFPAPRAAIGQGGPAPFGLGQRRTVLDAALLAVARATPGVRVFEGATVENVMQRRGRTVGLIVDGRAVPGLLVVGADGARSIVRRSLRLDGAASARPRMGVRMHFRLAAGKVTPSVVQVFVGPGHELYLTPLPDGEVLVAALAERGPTEADARAAMRAWIAEHPPLDEMLRGAQPISTPRGRFPLGHTARAGIAPGAVLLGDAAGFSDPITGGGMAQALLSAELLARYLPRALADRDDEWLWRFDTKRRAMLRDYLWLTKSILTLARRPAWARGTLRAMRANPAVMRHLVGVAGGLRSLI